MEALYVLAFLTVLAFFGITGWGVKDTRDGKDWQPMHWPSALTTLTNRGRRRH